MAKLGILASIFTIMTAFAVAALPTSSASADTPPACKTKDFKTQLVKEACEKGGQPAAKDAMKKFMKSAKIKSCRQCHSELSPNYTLKKTAVDQFKKAGGKLLAD